MPTSDETCGQTRFKIGNSTGSLLSITEITEYKYFSPLKPIHEFKYKSEWNIVPLVLILEPILFLWNIILGARQRGAIYYTRIWPQCDFSILGQYVILSIRWRRCMPWITLGTQRQTKSFRKKAVNILSTENEFCRTRSASMMNSIVVFSSCRPLLSKPASLKKQDSMVSRWIQAANRKKLI